MASMFTSMLYWMDGKLATVQDVPSDPIYTFTKGNVLSGQFNYETTARTTRFNQITVTYNEPENDFQPTPVIVEDREAILRQGKIIKSQAVAFGCTSESQAIRFGRWKLFTTQNQTEIVSFQTSIGANFLRPGDVVNIANSERRKQFEIGFTQPYFLGRRMSAGFDIFHIDNDYRRYSSYRSMQSGASIRAVWPLSLIHI